MLRLAAARAVLSGHLPEALAVAEGIRLSAPLEAERAVSAAAAYALAAVEDLGPLPSDPALYTVSGPPDSNIRLFDKAWRAAADGRIAGEGFARSRARRIHPLSLLLSLHNQVAATLSLRLGLRGPCTNAIESAASVVDLMPAMALELRDRPVLLVLSSAANRAEERSRNIFQSGVEEGCEGAIALLFRDDGGCGRVRPSEGRGEIALQPGNRLPDASDTWPFAPCLQPGLGLLWALASGRDAASFEIREPGRTASFEWRAA